MKYGYNVTKKDGLIKCYNVVDDEIIIEFLDKSTYSVPYSVKNEQIVLNKMVEQAKTKNEEADVKELNSSRDDYALKFVGNLLVWYLSHLSMEYINNASTQFFCLLVMIINSYCAARNVMKYHDYSEEIEELEKYDTYLDMMDDLELCSEDELFHKVNNSSKSLNINTLDNYSLKEIKQIKKNLINSREYKNYINENENNESKKVKLGM